MRVNIDSRHVLTCLPYHTDNNFCRLCAPFTPSTTSFRQTLNSPGVAYFDFGHNEYFIATNNIEMMVSPMTPLSNWWASRIFTTPLTLSAW